MKININDPIQESKILDGLDAMQQNNDPKYAEAYDWYRSVYIEPRRREQLIAQAPPEFPVEPTTWDRVEDVASSVIQSPTTKALLNVPTFGLPGIGSALQYLDRNNVGRRTWGGLQELLPQREISSDLVDIGSEQQAQRDYQNRLLEGLGRDGPWEDYQQQLTLQPDTRGIGAPFSEPEPYYTPQRTAQPGSLILNQDQYQQSAQRIPTILSNILDKGKEVDWIRLQTLADAGPMDDEGLRHILAADDWIETLKRMHDNPDAAFQVFGNSLGYSLPTLATSLLAGMVIPGIGGLAASGALAGGGSYITEFAFAAEEVLSELGIDIRNPEHLNDLAKNPEKLNAAIEAMKKKAAAVGLMDMLGMSATVGLARRAGKAKTQLSRAGYGLGAAATDASTEFGGELLGTRAAVGKWDVPAATMEGVIGLGMGGATTLPVMVSEALQNRTATPEYLRRVLEKALTQRETLNEETVLVLEGALETLSDPQVTDEQMDAVIEALGRADSAGAFATQEGGQEKYGAAAVFHIDSIMADLQRVAGDRKVTRAQAKAKALELVGHEIEVHVALRKAIQALGLSTEEVDEFYKMLDRDNAQAINVWLRGAGRNYAGDDRQTQIEEWIANEVKRRTQQGGKFVRFLRKFFKDKSGLDLTSIDAVTLVEKLGRQARGEAAPLQPAPLPPVVSRPSEVVPDTPEVDLDLEGARAEKEAELTRADELMGDIFETTAEQVGSAGRRGPMYAKRAADMTEAEKLNRNVRNDFAKGPYKKIIGREDEEEIRARIKRLGNLFGPMGQKRGINPGDRATAKEQAQNAIDNVEAFEEFMAPFEAQMKEQPAVSRTKRGRQAKYAEKKGITVDEILSYRDRGKIHPMERKMSYEFANEEINRLEAEGVITPAEAEARRVKLREFQSELQGRMPPGAKRKATEIVFGIGDYANIEAWEFTEEQTQAMEERADLAKARERVTGTRRARPTQQQAAEILEADITAEEAAQISMMAGSEMFDHLTTDEARLAFLREEEAMSAEERAALDEFKKDPQAYNEAEFLAQRKAEQEAQAAEVEVTVVEQTPAQRKAELKAMKEAQAPIEKRKHIQVEPDFFETLEQPLFTVQGETIPEGYMELTEDGVVEEAEDAGVLYALKETKTRKDKVTKIIQFFFKMVLDPDKTSNEVRKELQAIFRGEGKYSVLSEEEVAVLIGFYEDRRGRAWLTWSPTKRTQPKAEPSGDRKDMSQETIDMLLEDDFFGGKTTENGKTTYDFFTVNSATGLFTPIFTKFNRYRRQLYQLLAEKNVARRAAGKAPYNPGNKINRNALEAESPSAFNIDDVMATRTRLNKASGGKNFFMDHVRELVTEKMIQKLYEGASRFSAHVASNLAVMYKPIHDMKGMFGKRYPKIQESARPYTAMLEFMKGNKSGEFIDHWTNKWNISKDELIKKVEDYLDTVKEGAKEGKVVEATVRAAAAWEGNETVEASLLSAAQQEDRILSDNPELKKNLENTVALFAKKMPSDPVKMEEHFNNNFWYVLTSYLWGKPVQAIRDFNKLRRFGREKANVPEADVIADTIQRAHSAEQRAEGLKYGTDLMQDTSMKLGEYFTRLYQIFSFATGRLGDLNANVNKVLVDYLTDKIRLEEIDNADLRETAKMLKDFIKGIYSYAKEQTKHLKNPLDLRGHGDTLLPRVWNIEYLATRVGKARFIRIIRAAISDPATGSSILEETDLTIEDLYDVVVNSGGFVQGDWTNLKADQTRSEKDIERDQKAQEYLDALPTEVLRDAGLVLDDLQAILPRFVQKAVERTEYSKVFGVNDEILREMIERALAQIKEHNAKVLKLSKEDQKLAWIDPKRFTKAVWDMARILRNKYGYDLANMSTRAFLQRLTNFQVVVKLPLVTLASMPELFTPMLRGDVRFDKWVVDFMLGLSWAGYKGMNGLSKLLLNKHLPAMRKKSSEIGGIGVVSNAQLLRELGVYEIQSMGDMVSTRYANPNFARGGLRAGARGTIAGRVPKKIRAIFNMQTYMQATLLTTLTEMQQLMALRNFQRVVAKRIKFIFKNKGKKLTGRRARLYKQFKQDLADYGITEDIDLDTAAGEAAFNAGAIRFVDQVITRPNDATTAKAFKNPLTAPIFLFKRFITTFGNTLMTSVGNDFAGKVDNIERAKQGGRILAAITAMYGAVMFAEIIRGAIKGDLDDDDMTVTGGDFRSFVRRVDRTGLLSAPGAMIVNLAFPYKRGWWDSPEARIWGEFGGPIGGDLAGLMKAAMDDKPGSWRKLVRQIVPMSKKLVDLPPKKKRGKKKSTSIYGSTSSTKKSSGSLY